jgi:hypothetical protein
VRLRILKDDELLEVSVEDTASAEEVELVRQAFEAVGVHADVEANYGRKSVGELLPWIVSIGGPIGIFVAAFAKKLGENSADGIGRVVKDLYERRSSASPTTAASGHVVINDRFTVVLGEALPIEAYQQLPWLAHVDGIQARWNMKRRCWEVCGTDFRWREVLGPLE